MALYKNTASTSMTMSLNGQKLRLWLTVLQLFCSSVWSFSILADGTPNIGGFCLGFFRSFPGATVQRLVVLVVGPPPVWLLGRCLVVPHVPPESVHLEWQGSSVCLARANVEGMWYVVFIIYMILIMYIYIYIYLSIYLSIYILYLYKGMSPNRVPQTSNF